MNNIFDYIFLDNSIKAWSISLGIIVTCIILSRFLRTIVVTRLKKFASHTQSTIDDFVVQEFERTIMPFLYILGVYAGIQYLNISNKVDHVLRVAIMVVAVFFIIRLITGIVRYLFQNLLRKRQGQQVEIKQAKGILTIINAIIWIVGIVFLVDNLGYNITTIITGLGIGGIAIALAAQAILADLFSYLVIFFDKPFETGDFIIIGDKMGVVDYIGIKTTRLRAIGGEQLIIANTDLTNSRVQNYKRMEKRRVVFSIGIAYETPVQKLKEIPGMIEAIIVKQDDAQFDRAHFAAFGNFSLNFEIVYFILSADYNMYMDRQQSIYLAIVEKFESESILFAYPTQTLYVNSQSSREDGETGKKAALPKTIHN